MENSKFHINIKYLKTCDFIYTYNDKNLVDRDKIIFCYFSFIYGFIFCAQSFVMIYQIFIVINVCQLRGW